MTPSRMEEPVALYRRIYRDLKARIEAGEYKAGDRLPSEMELATSYGVSRITSRQALDLLSFDGMVSRRQGMGTFVSSARVDQTLTRLTDFVEDMSAAGLQPKSHMLRIHDETVPDDLAALLGVPDNTVVTRLDRLRLADDIPVALDWTWLPPRFGRLLKGEDLGARTIYEVIESDYGIPILYGEYTIEACLAGEDQAQLLAIIPNAPVLLVSRTSYTIHNRIVYHQRRFYRADRVKYWVRLDRTDSPSDPMESSSPVLDDAK